MDAQARDELTRSAADLSSFYLYFASEIPDQEVRDRAMADNVRQLVDSGHRVIVWVHNGHVANAPGSFGGFLRKRYGKDYVPVGLTTFSGTYSGLEPGTNLVGEYKLYPSPEQSLEAYLQKTGHVTAYVDLRTTKGRAVPQWLGTPLPCRPDIGFFRQPEAQSSDVARTNPSSTSWSSSVKRREPHLSRFGPMVSPSAIDHDHAVAAAGGTQECRGLRGSKRKIPRDHSFTSATLSR